MKNTELIADLNPEQQKACLATEGPVLILAGAGSGKTRVIVHRIAYLIAEKGVNPGNIMAITFTNKAAGEMRERVDKMVGFGSHEIQVSTFHSLCARILRNHADRLGYTRYYSIYDTDDQLTLMKQIFKSRHIDTKKMKERTALNAISSAKNELIDPDKYGSLCGHDWWGNQIAELYETYQNALKENNAMDFDDLLMKTVELFEGNPDILEGYQNRFRYMMVDEYQDTNTAQFKFISLLAAKYRNLCVVGDDDQSIYRFRGANIKNILNFEKIFPDAKVIRLEQNYRSTKNILAAANEVIKNNKGRKVKKLWTENEEGPKVRFCQFTTAYKEAEGVADEISRLVREKKYDYRDIAVLYRTNAQSRLFEEKFLFANIPYQIVGGVNFYQRKEIKDLLAYLKTVSNGRDDLAAQRIVNIPKRGIGQTTIGKLNAYAEQQHKSFLDAAFEAENIPSVSKATAKKIKGFTDFIEEMREQAGKLSVSGLLNEIIEKTGYVNSLKLNQDEESDARIENIDELVSKAVQYEESHEDGGTLDGFLEEVALIADIDNVSEDDNRVLLMTLHAAKGLEFPVVYMVGMEDGLFPSSMSIGSEDSNEEIEEERRLAYVGITRAKKELTLTCAMSRMIHGEYVNNPISRFVEEIPKDMVDVVDESDGYGAYGSGSGVPYYAQSLGKAGGLFGGMKDALSFEPEKLRPIHESENGRTEKSESVSTSKKIKKAAEPAGAMYMSSKASKITKHDLDYQVGDTVHHVKYGDGTVKAIEDGEKDYKVTVDFPGWGEKKMLASFARLKKC